jgi:hypothetical protein
MTNKETTSIALKCFAIYVLSRVLLTLPSYAFFGRMLNNTKGGASSAVWTITIPALSVIIGITTAFLIWKSTNSLMTQETSPVETGEIGVNGVMKIILACMGIYFAIDAVIHFPSALASCRFYAQVNNPNPQTTMVLITQGLKLTFGCLLIAKPGKWAKAIRSIGEI